MLRLPFQIESEAPGSRARAGGLTTLHGEVRTPVFMPVGTQATVKSQTVESLKEAGARVLLANTYHLLLRPGPEVFRLFGGIHRFMNWDGPVLTDSGGFQIFSLPRFRQMNEEGARFQSHVDGQMHLLTPELSIAMQRAINSDIMMVLDQCVPSTVEHAEARAAMELTHRWARRSLAARGDSPQALFAIVQGACYPDLRRASAADLRQLPFDGFAIGGLAVGESMDQRNEFTELTAGLLPRDRPRYLMGVGTPLDILEAVHRGVDMFDCILPSQLAQRGTVFTSIGRLQLRRGSYKFSEEALDPDCPCPACRDYSRAYLHHLTKTSEVLGWYLLTRHNITFYQRLMRRIRENILAGTFAEFYRAERVRLALSDDTEATGARVSLLRPTAEERLGDYEVHTHPKGFCSIRQRSSGEIMHSVSEPTEEADRLYVQQSALTERLAAGNPALVIWDVGLGAATNAMAAVRAWESVGEAASLRIVSFERDLDPLRLALRNPERFTYLQHPAPAALLETGRWQSECGRLRWELVTGDFLTLLETAPPADLIFYDPFSSKTDSALWTPAIFSRIYRHCAERAAELYTYSASTAVRASLLAAGFFVAKGFPTGPKVETTVAFIPRDRDSAREGLLGDEWLKRWGRSDAKFPGGMSEESRAAFAARILAHPQFVSPSA